MERKSVKDKKKVKKKNQVPPLKVGKNEKRLREPPIIMSPTDTLTIAADRRLEIFGNVATVPAGEFSVTIKFKTGQRHQFKVKGTGVDRFVMVPGKQYDEQMKTLHEFNRILDLPRWKRIQWAKAKKPFKKGV